MKFQLSVFFSVLIFSNCLGQSEDSIVRIDAVSLDNKYISVSQEYSLRSGSLIASNLNYICIDMDIEINKYCFNSFKYEGENMFLYSLNFSNRWYENGKPMWSLKFSDLSNSEVIYEYFNENGELSAQAYFRHNVTELEFFKPIGNWWYMKGTEKIEIVTPTNLYEFPPFKGGCMLR